MTRAPDPLFADRRLAATYDTVEGERHDLDAYEAIVGELGAASVLDIGCGTGVLACRLARRGCAVTALDPAAASLEIATAKPGADAVTWIHGDAAAAPPVIVDLAVMTGNVAQVFVADEEWHAALRAIAIAVRPGGHLVFETRDPARRAWEGWTSAATRQRAVLPDGDGFETWCEVTDVVDDLVSFRWTTVFDADGVTLTSDSTVRFRSVGEIEAALRSTGFRIVDVRDAPDRPGLERVVVAQRTPG